MKNIKDYEYAPYINIEEWMIYEMKKSPSNILSFYDYLSDELKEKYKKNISNISKCKAYGFDVKINKKLFFNNI